MRRSFLLRIVFLALLAAAVVLTVVTMRSNSSGATTEAGTGTFFEQFVIAGGPIVWFILLPMSLITVFLSAEYGLTIRRKKLLPEAIGNQIVETIEEFGPAQLETRIGNQKDFLSKAILKAVAKGDGDWFRMRSLIAESLQDQALELLRKIEWVNLLGNVSPMVGLFGTVCGMITLFNALVIAGGQPQPAQLAGGISVALVTTFWGLFIAIPALGIYGVFRNRIETLISDAVEEAENIMPEIRRSLKKQSVIEQTKRPPIQELQTKSVKLSGKSG